MKVTVYIVIFFAVITMFFTTGCTGKSASESDSITDTLVTDSLPQDTLETLIGEQPVPKAADELFDDFIFNFAANRKHQLSRIQFPLKMDNYGKVSYVEKKAWRMERFFMHQGFYTLVAGSMKELNSSKSTKIDHVVVEKVFLQKNIVCRYVFNRVDGQWMMQEVNTQSMAQNPNGQFYAFYDKFVNDSAYQHKSLADVIDFKGPDPEDDFSSIEGVIDSEQWSLFAPELPGDMIYNIVYGNVPPKGSQRVLVIRGIANGLETELTFRKTADGWQLIKLNT